MLKHIVMWKFKDDVENELKKSENIEKAKSLLEDLESKIDCINELEVGINEDGLTGSFDLVLSTSFNDESDLEKYQNHPDHLEVGKFIKRVVYDRACVDYVL